MLEEKQSWRKMVLMFSESKIYAKTLKGLGERRRTE